jgi:hypothetical protein
MIRVVVATLFLCLAACDSVERQVISDAEQKVASLLRDPSSAQFRNVRHRVSETGANIVCGEVNAKNAFGGYAGFQRFLYDAGTAKLDDGDEPDFDQRWWKLCF